jgi:CBS domain-containing protein
MGSGQSRFSSTTRSGMLDSSMNDGGNVWPRSWFVDASLPVRQYMQRGMRYVGMGMRADKIIQFMWEAGLTEVPVLDDAKRPVGLISLGELIESGRANERLDEAQSTLALRDSAPWMEGTLRPSKRVEDVMTFGIPTVHQGLSLANAAARMLRSERECLVVVDDQGVAVGSLSMSDVMRWLVEQTSDGGRTIRGEAVTPGVERGD